MTQRARRMISALTAIGLLFGGAGTLAPAPLMADAGPYLAARQATMDRSFQELASYATRALASDPQNPVLLESVISAHISMGDFETTKGYAALLSQIEPGNQIAAMSQLTLLVKEGDYDGLVTALEGGQSISTVVDGLMLAWAHVGQGDMSGALELFDNGANLSQGFEDFGHYNKALALGLVGDFEGALEVLTESGIRETRSSVIARIEILSQLERNDEALTVLNDNFGEGELDPVLEGLRESLTAGETVPFTVVRSARDGIADVFFAVAAALDGGLDDGYTLLYARIAETLRPDEANYVLNVATLLERLGNYDLATAAFDSISPEDPVYPIASLGRAETLRAAGKSEAALEVLRQLAKAHPEMDDVHIALGDALRREERYAEAAEAYSVVIDRHQPPTRALWPLYFTRGTSYERLEEWEKSEADLRQALELEPDQPQVLNYLGYSFLELKTNLDEAMEMIRKAAEMRPQDGYITDSLAWGLYRLGRYEEAVEPMERAAELMPVDPIINDHLGDVYWAVGRVREARFQWKRALSFDPEEDEANRIRRKLEVGLDRVLIDEGEEPTRPINDG
ncbi:tetratricopeptide repeat protein [Celeribacter halophilus]|uniref:Tetratricopeptide repeat protein n=1 Tax=Celeribacter halophilus TaxID=576117 RepID=A0AAW7XWI1_9RHOB|nr:tetratricopeptide repeat protein [Celeribacter halophilus]MDO6458320.1 tetratricopeptide repeat protein [Celeribacter halophilus]MDO6724181.1 tetratricopeptide repeat protein [Celeribacter halophilus]